MLAGRHQTLKAALSRLISSASAAIGSPAWIRHLAPSSATIYSWAARTIIGTGELFPSGQGGQIPFR